MLCFKDNSASPLSVFVKRAVLHGIKNICKMIQISIFSGSSPASRRVTPLWRGLCQLCARAAGTNSRWLSPHCSLETQMQTQSRQ